MSGFRMVESRSDSKWSDFRMTFENRTFFAQTLRKPDVFWPDHSKTGHFRPFENGCQKRPVFECFRYLNVWFSDPHCTELSCTCSTSFRKQDPYHLSIAPSTKLSSNKFDSFNIKNVMHREKRSTVGAQIPNTFRSRMVKCVRFMVPTIRKPNKG